MAGILNSKTRIVDFILTDEGRSQVRNGDLKIEFASFTDRDTFYEEDLEGAASSAGDRIFFEATGRYQDKIVIESNEGIISNFKTSDYDLSGIQVETSPVAPRTASETETIVGAEVINRASEIITQITKNFYDQEMISNEDIFSSIPGFDISKEELVFKPTDKTPLVMSEGSAEEPSSVSEFESLLTDKKFAHFPHFKFMPPINEASSERGGQTLGIYPNFNQAEIITYDDLKLELEGIPYEEIVFSPTSRDNNIIIQPFEFESGGSIEKLQVVDFGTFVNEAGTNAGVRVFFIGKFRKSPTGDTKFFNIFTLELDV